MNNEPAWWGRARERRARNVSMGVIARIEGKDITSVRYALLEDYRERKKVRSKQWHERRAK